MAKELNLNAVQDVIDHDRLAGLTDDDHSQYAMLSGRAGGQTLQGGNASGDNLTLESTSDATKGKILWGANSAYDEVNDRLGIGTASPDFVLDLRNGGTSKHWKTELGVSANVFHTLNANSIVKHDTLNSATQWTIEGNGTGAATLQCESAGATTQLRQLDTGVAELNFVGNSSYDINAGGADCDMRIRSASNSNMFYLDAGLSRVGIGLVPTDGIMHLKQPTAATNTHLIVEGNTTGQGGIKLVSSTGAKTTIFNQTATTCDLGWIGSTTLFDVNATDNDVDYRYRTPSVLNMFFIDAGQANIGIGGKPTNLSALLQLDATNKALLLPRLATASIVTPVNGMVIYDSGTDKFRGYAGGAWVDLH